MAETILKQVTIPEEVLQAENITFDNTGTGLSSTDANDAIVEVLTRLTTATNELKSLISTAQTNANSYTNQKITDLIGGAPTTLDTLKEIADAMAENESVVSALNNAIGNKLDKSGGKLTGILDIGGFLKLWSDNEGGNIDIYPPSSIGGRWCIDAYNGNLRIFHYTAAGVIDRTYTFYPSNGRFDGIASNVYGTVGIGNGGTGATTAAAAMHNLAPNHFSSPAYLYTMGSNGYAGGSGYSTIAELITAMKLDELYIKEDGSNGALNPVNDLNNFYTGISLFHGGSAANAPDSNWWLVISAGTSGTVTQVAYQLLTGQCLTRYCASGSWSKWSNSITLNAGKIESNGHMYLRSQAAIVATGYYDSSSYIPMYASSFVQASSKNVKENILNITVEEARKILDVNVISFDYKKGFGGQKNNFGVIAEEVKDIIPYAVIIPDDYNEETFDEKKGVAQSIPSVDYSKFVPYLIKMVQIQQEEINMLKREITELKSVS